MAVTNERALVEERPGVLRLGSSRAAILNVEFGVWALRNHIEAMVGAALADDMMQQAGARGGMSLAESLMRRGEEPDERAFRECLATYQAAGFGRFWVERFDWEAGRVVVKASDSFEAWNALRHGQMAGSPRCAYSAGVLVGLANVLGARRDIVCVETECQAHGAPECVFQLSPSTEAGKPQVVSLQPNPFVARQLNLLEILFERMPMGIALFDSSIAVRRFNPTWASFVAQYTRSPLSSVVPGAQFYDLAPGVEATTAPLFEKVLQGETVRQHGLRLESEGIVSYWDVVMTPFTEDGKVVGIVEVTTDATERVAAYQALERRVEERTYEIERRQRIAEGSRDILAILNSNRPLEETLDYIVEEAGRLLDTDTSAIFRLRPDGALTVQASCGLPADYTESISIPLGKGAVGSAVLGRVPVTVPDLHNFMQAGALGLDEDRRVLLKSLAWHHRGLLAVPLIIKDQVYGGLVFYYTEPHEFSREEIDLAMTLGDHAALAIENARLREKAEQAAVAAERSRLARDLHDSVTQTLFAASLIAEVLPRLWDRNQGEGLRRLEELRQLTRGGLAEMRTLLLELRPAALTEVGLGDLLRQLSEAIIGRARVPVKLNVEGQATLPPDVQISLYRIAQEALNNVARHSGAEQAEVTLRYLPGNVELRIADDGRGFDPASITPEHLGLGIMRERAESIGAVLEIDSSPGRGTEIRTTWQETQRTDEAKNERN